MASFVLCPMCGEKAGVVNGKLTVHWFIKQATHVQSGLPMDNVRVKIRCDASLAEVIYRERIGLKDTSPLKPIRRKSDPTASSLKKRPPRGPAQRKPDRAGEPDKHPIVTDEMVFDGDAP
jgi:hypothetical protein